MPNFRIPNALREEITKAANVYIDRTEIYAMANFPLSVEQVQHGVIPPHLVAAMQALLDQGIETLEMFDSFNILIEREKVPGMLRSAAFILAMPKPIFLPHRTYYHYDEKTLPPAERAIRLDVSSLTQDELTALGTWANDAVRQHRLARMAKLTVNEITEKYCSTTQHMRALWPFLETLVKSSNWKQKFDVKTRALEIYKPDPKVLAEWGKLMGVAELIITQGSILTKFERQPGTILPSMMWWEQMAGDKHY